MRYSIPKNYIDDVVEIEYNNRIYTIDDSEANFQEIQKILKNNGTVYEVIAQAVGKEAADEIMATRPSHKVVEMLGTTIAAAFKGVDPKEAQEAYFRTRKRK